MMVGQDTGSTPLQKIKYVEAERPPNPKELDLWTKAERIERRVTLLSYAVKNQFHNIVLTHNFAKTNAFSLEEPELPELEKRMLLVLSEVKTLTDDMCGVRQLELGIRVSDNGKDLDIVEPDEMKTMGWVIPAIGIGLLVAGIIARWIHLENEVSDVTAKYNGILKRSDMALCSDPHSKLCIDWESVKKTGGYYKRQTLVESIKSAADKVGTAAKKGLGAGLAMAIPLLLWLYLPRKKGS